MIKNGYFTSVWSDGYTVTTNCKVDTETNEISDIEKAEVNDNFEVLEYEYITFDEVEYPVINKSEIINTDKSVFWYE